MKNLPIKIKEFRINEESLVTRIENLKLLGFDVSGENEALRKLREQP